MGGGYLSLICLDKTQEFDAKSIEFKSKKNPGIRSNSDYYLELLSNHHKILRAEKSGDDSIIITPIDDFEKVKTILGRIFSKKLFDENITLSEEKINNSRNIILKLL